MRSSVRCQRMSGTLMRSTPRSSATTSRAARELLADRPRPGRAQQRERVLGLRRRRGARRGRDFGAAPWTCARLSYTRAPSPPATRRAVTCMNCPRCKSEIGPLESPDAIVTCPGCGTRLMTRSAALRSQGGAAAAGAVRPARRLRPRHRPATDASPGQPARVEGGRAADDALGQDDRSGAVALADRARQRPTSRPSRRRDARDAARARSRPCARRSRSILDALAGLRARAGRCATPATGARRPTDDETLRTTLSPIRAPQRKTVVLLDDDARTREAAAAELEQADIPVRAFADGNKALAAIAEDKPDVIVLELAVERRPGRQGPRQHDQGHDGVGGHPDRALDPRDRLEPAEARQIHGADEVVSKSHGAAALVARVITRLPPLSARGAAARPRLGSPRRAQILRELGVAVPRGGLARGRGAAAGRGRRGGGRAPGAREGVLASPAARRCPCWRPTPRWCCDGRILGKPADAAEAVAMLQGLAGRTHEVVTGLCLARGGEPALGRRAHERALRADERAPSSPGTRRRASRSTRPAATTSTAGARLFVEAVYGSPSNVAGLPVRLLLRLVARGRRRPRLAEGVSALARPNSHEPARCHDPQRAARRLTNGTTGRT